MKKIILIAATVTISSVAAFAIGKKILASHNHPEFDQTGPFDTSHSGGLDRNGGHYDHKNGGYHFHR